jgi:hypothetical protein
MTYPSLYRKGLLTTALLLAALCVWTGPARADDIKYEGLFEMQPNGDCNTVIKMTPPMLIYQKLRESMSNLYLIMRSFASSRATTETVDKKADWDDSSRTLTFSMKLLGIGRNMGNHWELDTPKDMEFSNLDEAKRTLFFNQTISGEDWTIRGVTRVILPQGASAMKWDAGRRVASYAMPIPKAPGADTLPLALGGGLVGLGAILLLLSFVLKSPPKTA